MAEDAVFMPHGFRVVAALAHSPSLVASHYKLDQAENNTGLELGALDLLAPWKVGCCGEHLPKVSVAST